MHDALTQLGNYRLTRLLGSGGFAEVYLGEHIHLKTKAAIKVLQAQLTEDDKKNFTREAQIVANLVHPNIVRVLEFGIENDIPFLVMDYASGGTVRQAMGQPLPLPTIVSYIKQIASALQYAHDKKIIHRDVKPENMLLGQHDELLLSDFGIALVTQSSRYQSRSPLAAGTISYMAPEQLQGHPCSASDQYSLGIVVYEWLSGERPFKGSYTEVGSQHMFAPPPSLRARVPTIPSEVEDVVFTALAKEPQRRFASVQLFAQAFEPASQGRTDGSAATRYTTIPIPPSPSSSRPSSTDPTVLASPPAGTPFPNMGTQPAPPLPSFSSYPPLASYPPIAPYGPVPVVMTPPSKKNNGCCIAVAITLLVVVVLSVVGALAPALIGTIFRSANPSATPDAHDASVQAGATLYNEQGTDNWSGWSLSGEWKTLHGALLSDGTAGNQTSPGDTIWAPHQVGVANYAIQATIQITSPAQNCYFALVGRATHNSITSGSSSYTGYAGGLASADSFLDNTALDADIDHYPSDTYSYSSSSTVIAHQSYDPGTSAHTYRLEFVDNHITLKIDNGTIVQAVDNVALTGGLVGLQSGYCQLSISNFSITKL